MTDPTLSPNPPSTSEEVSSSSKPRISLGRYLWLELRSWLSVLLPFFIITTFLVTITGVDGKSMMPNLRHGERIIIPKYETWLHRLGIGSFQRGDIVVFKPGGEIPGVERDFFGLWTYRPYFIKRVVAVAGDTVRMQAGEVFVNNRKINQAFITDFWKEQQCWDQFSSTANYARSDYSGFTPMSKSITVPAGQYFVMGDNRSQGGSEDSRMIGTVPLETIAGRAALVWWPFVRHISASYDCNTADVRLSGPSGFNPRALEKPTGWNP